MKKYIIGYLCNSMAVLTLFVRNEIYGSSSLNSSPSSTFIKHFFNRNQLENDWKWTITKKNEQDHKFYKDNGYQQKKNVADIKYPASNMDSTENRDYTDDSSEEFIPTMKRIKISDKNERFIWRRPFNSWPFLEFIYDDYTFPRLNWSRKPKDMLMVVFEQQQQPTTVTSPQCVCRSAEVANATTNATRPTLERHIKDQPSSCVWAIIACCSPVNFHYRYGCFHFLSCTILFWQVEPCQLPIILAATREAIDYYNQFTETPTVFSTTPSSSTTTNNPSTNHGFDTSSTSSGRTTKMTETPAVEVTETSTVFTTAETTETPSTISSSMPSTVTSMMPLTTASTLRSTMSSTVMSITTEFTTQVSKVPADEATTSTVSSTTTEFMTQVPAIPADEATTSIK